MKPNAVVNPYDVHFIATEGPHKITQEDRDTAKLLFFEYARSVRFQSEQYITSFFKYYDELYGRIASFNTFEIAVAFYEMFEHDNDQLRIMKWNNITFDVVVKLNWKQPTLLDAIKTWWRS